MASELGSVGVVGIGTIGAGLVGKLTAAGVTVVAVEKDAASAAAAGERTGVTVGTDLAALSGCTLVVEALPEDRGAKGGVLAEIAAVVGDGATIATTASVLPVTALAVASGTPARVIGLHWTLSPDATGAVEIVKTPLSDADAVKTGETLAAVLEQAAVTVGDKPGLVMDGLVLGYLNDAIRMVEAGYATRDDVDAAMRFGCGHPAGPLSLADQIGLDTLQDLLTGLYEATGDHLLAPAPLLGQYIAAGWLGRKSGRGFYSYAAAGSAEVTDIGGHSGSSLEEARSVSRIGVVGTGTMASGIVEVCAKAGYDVVFRARGDEKVAAVQKGLEKSLNRQVERGKLTEEKKAALLGRITGSTELAALADCDLVIEAVVEDLAIKKQLFAELDAIVKPGAVLATTTSSLPVIECATATSRPADVVGMHWFNPAQVMKLVELVPTVVTSPDVLATIREVSIKCGKHPVVCGDRAGFIVNALLFPYLNNAVKLLTGHYATADEIDTVWAKALGHPMGPFALIDVVGMDVTLAIQEVLHGAFLEPGLTPDPLLGQLCAAGFMGRKAGRGFRDYAKK